MQVRHLPSNSKLIRSLLQPVHAFTDGILVGTGKSRENILACIRRPVRHWHARQALDCSGDLRQVRKIQAGLDAACVKIIGQHHQVHIAGAFSMPKERTLHPLRPGQ